MLEIGIANFSSLMICLLMLTIIFYVLGFISPALKKLASFIIRYLLVPNIVTLFMLGFLLYLITNNDLYLLVPESFPTILFLAIVFMRVLRINLLPNLLKYSSIRRKKLVLVITSLLLFSIMIGAIIPNRAGVIIPDKIIEAKYFDGLLYCRTPYGFAILDTEYRVLSNILIKSEIINFIPTRDGIIYFTKESIQLVNIFGKTLWTIPHNGSLLDALITPNYLVALYEGNIIRAYFINDGPLFAYLNMTEYGIWAHLLKMQLLGKFFFLAGINGSNSVIIKFDIDELKVVGELSIENVTPIFLSVGEFLFVVTNPKPISEDVYIASPEGLFVDLISLDDFVHVRRIVLTDCANDMFKGGYAGEEAFIVYTSNNAYAIPYDRLDIIHINTIEDITDAFFEHGCFYVISHDALHITGTINKVVFLPMNINGGIMFENNIILYGDLYDRPATGIFAIDKKSGEVTADYTIRQKLHSVNDSFMMTIIFLYTVYLLFFVRDVPEKLKGDIIKKLEEELIKSL